MQYKGRCCICLHSQASKLPLLSLFIDKMDRKVEVNDFLKQFHTGCFSDVPVATMRHFIPLFLMEVYSEVYGQYSYKGMR